MSATYRSFKCQIFPASSAQVFFNRSNSVQYASTGVGSNQSSSAVRIDYATNYSVQAIYSGSLNGTISLNASNDAINFSPISGTNTVVSPPAAGTTGNFIWNVAAAAYDYIQFAYTASSTLASSAGNIRAILNSKGP